MIDLCFLLSLKVDKSKKSETSNTNNPKWKQVFSVNVSDFQAKQSDFVVNTCNRAGNIIMIKKQVMPVVEAFMSQLNKADTTRYIFHTNYFFILKLFDWWPLIYIT